ncbi:MAG TPA: DUF4124 domain-containing protein [Burkholderiales bacterium]|nr:DUF4124 domain-containing protein [Burkholderiales bacterium]
MHTFRLVFLVLVVAAGSASAQVYRWVDAKGTVHYSNDTPPPGAKATKLDIDAKPGPAAPDTQDCYTLRCQGERMEERVARREETDARIAAQRVAATPPAVSSQKPRGLEFRKYISIQRGMSEGELVGIAGAPDMLSRERGSRTYTYLPVPGDPFTTTIVLVGGRVTEIERVRKF